MTKLQFHSNSTPTVGVEVELGIVDAGTLQLVSGCSTLLQRMPQQFFRLGLGTQ